MTWLPRKRRKRLTFCVIGALALPVAIGILGMLMTEAKLLPAWVGLSAQIVFVAAAVVATIWLFWVCPLLAASDPDFRTRPTVPPRNRLREFQEVPWLPCVFVAVIGVMLLIATALGHWRRFHAAPAIAWPDILSFLAMLTATAVPAWALRRPIGVRYRRAIYARRICFACGYDLRGSPTGVCPECGWDNAAMAEAPGVANVKAVLQPTPDAPPGGAAPGKG